MKKVLLFTFYFLLFTSAAFAQRFQEHNPAADKWVDSVMKHLSKKEKIAQLMVIRLSGIKNDTAIFYDKEVEQLIKKYKIGAVCLFQGSPYKQATVLNRLQSVSSIPLMVCIDAETGVGMRFTDSVLKFPNQLTLAAAHDTNLIYRTGKLIAGQCKRIGIQVNYAPVADINNNPENPVINHRSFGENKFDVAEYCYKIMRGMQDNGVMACAKHFPGHGDVNVDSHFDLPIINKSKAQLEELELYPFEKLIKEGVGSIMVAHLHVPSIDNTPNRPTSLSPNAINDLLRKDYHFNGLVFTDGLGMKGVTKFYPSGEASAQSLIAGNDMLCLPLDVKSSIKKTKEAIKKGLLSKQDLDEKVKKVLLAKYNLGLTKTPVIALSNITNDLNKDVNSIKSETYEKAITAVRLQNQSLLHLDKTKNIAYIALGSKKNNHFSGVLKKEMNADCFYLDYKDSKNVFSLIDKINQKKYDAVIIGLHQYSRFPADNFGVGKPALDILSKLEGNDNTLIAFFGNPYAIKIAANAKNVFACYEDDDLMYDAMLKVLQGNIKPNGKLPVTVLNKK